MLLSKFVNIKKNLLLKTSALLFSLLFSVLLTLPAWAHPHVFIDYQITFKQRGRALVGFYLVWTLDLMNSRLLMDEFDTNKDGQLRGAEAYEVAKNMRDNLLEFEYFTQVKVNGQRVPIRQVQNIRVTTHKNRVIYSLFLPCKVLVGSKALRVQVHPIDTTNYVAFSPHKKGAVHVSQSQLRFKVLKHPLKMYDSLQVLVQRAT